MAADMCLFHSASNLFPSSTVAASAAARVGSSSVSMPTFVNFCTKRSRNKDTQKSDVFTLRGLALVQVERMEGASDLSYNALSTSCCQPNVYGTFHGVRYHVRTPLLWPRHRIVSG